jgi:hypothetical protein
MSGKIVAVLVLLVAVAAAGLYVMQGNRQSAWDKSAPGMAPFTAPSKATARGMSRDGFFDHIAAYCKQHPDLSDIGSCVACARETCPTCGFGPERSEILRTCNPNGWDCAASGVFAPATGGSCGLQPYGPCPCPVEKSTNARETIFAALSRQTASSVPPREASRVRFYEPPPNALRTTL